VVDVVHLAEGGHFVLSFQNGDRDTIFEFDAIAEFVLQDEDVSLLEREFLPIVVMPFESTHDAGLQLRSADQPDLSVQCRFERATPAAFLAAFELSRFATALAIIRQKALLRLPAFPIFPQQPINGLAVHVVLAGGFRDLGAPIAVIHHFPRIGHYIFD
jgi:hypothetical protein